MPTAVKRLEKLPLALLALAFIGSFLSYQPLFYFGRLSGAHLELSLTLICLVLLVLGAVSLVFKEGRQVFLQPMNIFFILFSSYSTVSLLWTDNLARGVLIASLAWLITATWISILSLRRVAWAHQTLLINILLVSSLIVCLFAFWQVVGDALGAPSALTLLPDTYQSQVFGVARPTGFAVEPQFLGSLLLFPFGYALFQELRKRGSALTRIVLAVTFAVLVMTISRGALIAVVLITLILMLSHIKQGRALLTSVGIMIGALVFALAFIAMSAQVNTRDSIDGPRAIDKIVNHLSLGLVDLSQKGPTVRLEPAVAKPQPQTPTSATFDDGYVAESTNSRLLMSQEAIDLWKQSPQTVLFGIGIGSFGASLHAKNPAYSVSSIVNNQYVEVLTELGILGLLIFLAPLAYLLVTFIRARAWLFVALLVGFGAQWFFFSGNVNVLHIWLILALGYALLKASSGKQESTLLK